MIKKVEIFGLQYDWDRLPDAAKANLNNIKFCDERIRQLKSEWAISDTARMGYLAALKSESKGS
jgi:hypothetical protein